MSKKRSELHVSLTWHEDWKQGKAASLALSKGNNLPASTEYFFGDCSLSLIIVANV